MDQIIINENGLAVIFEICQDGVVTLRDFSSRKVENACKEKKNDSKTVHPVIEVQLTGKTSRDMHGYKHNFGSASLDFHYVTHQILKTEKGKELLLSMSTEYGLEALYHMQFFDGVPVVRVWSELTNRGEEAVGLEYVSSFIYQGISANGKKKYYEKTEIYIPHNSWCCEAQWTKMDVRKLNLSGMMVTGFNQPGYGSNRFCYTGRGSWSSNEYLPMGFAEDLETNEIYCFQIEHSGQWHVEYGSEPDERLYLALSGPTEGEHGWWKNLKPGDHFETIPVAFGVAYGDISSAVGALTTYRRAFRRPHPDEEAMHVVFNDYMNCLMGDPTEERELAIIDKAAALGCEYYCMDCGWYDDGFWWDRVGEWMESDARFPNGMKKVCDYAHDKGLKMGLWLEIEVMGIACEMAKRLPDDWFVCRHGKRHADNKRYLLDFRNPQVRNYCRGVMDRLINDYGIDFFKMDYNVTMGYGSDLNSDSCAEAISEHYACLYHWYEELLNDYPDLVIENCGSGGQRMDYGMLRLLSLQSTSDQTDYIHNSRIAANVACAVTPEQAGMWVYPYEDNAEHVIYNMVNGLLLRPYISGMVWKLSEESMSLLREGIELYKKIRCDIGSGLPVFPFGFSEPEDAVLAYGIITERKMFLAVFLPGTDEADIPLKFEKEIQGVSVLYPERALCEYAYNGEKLHVKMPQEKAARLFCFEF